MRYGISVVLITLISSASLVPSENVGPAILYKPLVETVKFVPPPWSAKGLDRELYPIAHLESSWGKNMNHQPHSKGPFYSSYGALGLKAITAYEAYLMSPKTQKWLKPGGEKVQQDTFFGLFTGVPEFYNRLANVHWWYLRKHTSSVQQAVFAWRWGLGAAQEAKPETISSDKYVLAYMVRNDGTRTRSR